MVVEVEVELPLQILTLVKVVDLVDLMVVEAKELILGGLLLLMDGLILVVVEEEQLKLQPVQVLVDLV